MWLKSLRIRDFRCIDDSGTFSLDQITCLVGKNESGKTATLNALHKLKPQDEKREKFEPARDYPRRKWRPDTAIPQDPPVLDTEWEFSDGDYSVLEKRFGKGGITKRTFTLSKGYDNVRRFGVSCDEQVILKNLTTGAQLDSDERKPISNGKTIKSVTEALAAVEKRTERQEKLYKLLTTDFKDGAPVAVINAIDSLLPTFLYFDQYLRLPGEISVNALLERKKSNQLLDGDRILEALLGLAGTTIDKLHSAATFEEFNASLRAVSNQISDQIFRYWSQNRHLDVQMRLDQARPSDPSPFNSGYIFRTRIDNRRHKADTSFDDRSSGFVWFFSFLIWFYRLRDTYKKNLLILLDEPGLTLHARAQADLLRYMNEQLRPDYQVIYTTHSPFMIDPDNILAARTVEDVVIKDKVTNEEKLFGTKVGEQVLSADPDTVSPLQRALDYELTQTLFIGRHTLLVEGPSDFLYLKWFSRQLQRLGKTGLDYRWNITIGGGVDRIPGFVSLFRGNRLHVAAVVDVQTGQKQKLEKAKQSLEKNHLLMMDEYAGQEQADIEDVLGHEFYVSLVNAAFELPSSLSLPTATASGTPSRVVTEVEARFTTMPPYVREFDHFVPAEYLFQKKDEGVNLPGFDSAFNRLEKLINDLNALL